MLKSEIWMAYVLLIWQSVSKAEAWGTSWDQWWIGVWEVNQGKYGRLQFEISRVGDDPNENHYNANNFIGALRRIGQFHNEHPETGETTGLTGSLPEGWHTGPDAGWWQTKVCQGSTEICMCSVLFLLISKWIPFLRPPQILIGEGRNDLINPARSRCCIRISRR
jgi:hypothetical protein